MPTECQLIIDPPQPGAWNMAVDEWLLNRAEDDGKVTLRFYQWSEPTLSLGYFQAYANRTAHTTSLACPVVRRASGGGALLHHHELTYSLAVPKGHPLAARTQQLYDAAHLSLVDILAQIVPPQKDKFSLCRESEPRGTDEPFLCFLRRAQGDVVFAQSSEISSHSTARSYKICGSAQRKHRGSVLQHGGVLIAGSPYAPVLPGLRELANKAITPTDLSELWLGPLVERLGLEPTVPQALSDTERAEVGAVQASKFANSSWTCRR